MVDTKIFEEMAKKITDNLPPALKSFKGEMEKNIKSIMQASFSKMDLVTRKEFDAQAKVLLRTREKLEALEKQMKSMSPTKKNTKPKARAKKSSAKR